MSDVDTYYQSVEDPPDSHIFDLTNSEAYFHDRDHCFFLRKKRPDEEINIRKLPQHVQRLWLDKGGAREKEWKNIVGTGSVRIHRGEKARELRRKYANRVIPSRWHEKWKDMGDGFDNGLGAQAAGGFC